MKCRQCGAEIPDGSTVCEVCGESQDVFRFRLKEDEPKPKETKKDNPVDSVEEKPFVFDYQKAAIQQYEKPLSTKNEKSDANVPALIAAGLLIWSMFLPYAEFWGFKATLMSDDGFDTGLATPFLAFALLAGVCAFFGKNEIVVVAGALATIWSIYHIIRFAAISMGIISKGIGFYLMIVASVGILITGFMCGEKKR